MSRNGKRLGPGSVLAKNQPTAQAIGDLSSAREAMLRRAGVGEEEQARVLQESVVVLRSSLGAMSILEPERPDWFARIKAAQCLLSLVGAFPSRSVSGSGTPQVTINIDVPDWAQPMMKARQAST